MGHRGTRSVWCVCRSVGDKQAATLWAGRAAESARLALGRDSDEFQKYSASVGSRREG